MIINSQRFEKYFFNLTWPAKTFVNLDYYPGFLGELTFPQLAL